MAGRHLMTRLMQLLANATSTRRNSPISCEERAAAEAAGSGRKCRDLRPVAHSLIGIYFLRALCDAPCFAGGDREPWASKHKAAQLAKEVTDDSRCRA